MSVWIDFEELKSRVTIEMILDHYSITLKRKNDELSGRCPLGDHDDKRASFSANTTGREPFQCFGCKKSGAGSLDLVSIMEGVNTRQAALLIQEWFPASGETDSKGPESGGRVEVNRETDVASDVSVAENTPLTFELKNLDHNHPYLKERGLNSEVVLYFGVGYCSKGMMKNRVVVPIHNPDGQLVAYSGRWPGDDMQDGEPKYKLPPNFHKSLELFNLHRVKKLAEEDRRLILVEGFFDCFKLHQAGYPNVVGIMGSSLSDRQRDMIVDLLGPGGQLTILMDGDDAGGLCRQNCLDVFSQYMFVRSPMLPEGSQPDQLSADELRQLLQ